MGSKPKLFQYEKLEDQVCLKSRVDDARRLKDAGVLHWLEIVLHCICTFI